MNRNESNIQYLCVWTWKISELYRCNVLPLALICFQEGKLNRRTVWDALVFLSYLFYASTVNCISCWFIKVLWPWCIVASKQSNTESIYWQDHDFGPSDWSVQGVIKIKLKCIGVLCSVVFKTLYSVVYFFKNCINRSISFVFTDWYKQAVMYTVWEWIFCLIFF